MEWIAVLPFAVLFPFTYTSIAGMWLVLFVCFGPLHLLVGQLEMMIAHRKTLIICVAGFIGALVVLFLLYDGRIQGIIFIIFMLVTGICMFIFGPVPLVVVAGEWLALICYFGLHYLCDRQRIQKLQQRHISQYVVTGILFVSIVTNPVSLVCANYLGLIREDSYGEAARFGVIALGPLIGLLTIGLAAMLVISLGLDLGESQERRRHMAKSMTIALSTTFVLLSIAGGVWSALIYPVWERLW